MAINFPTALDTLPKPANNQPMNAAGAQAGDIVSDLARAIEALQAKVGVNGSGVASTIDYFMQSVRGTKPAGAGSFTNISTTGHATVNGLLRGGFGALDTSGVKDWNDSTNARSGTGITLMRGTDAANAPPEPSTVSYFHSFNVEYGAKDGSGQVTQLAIPYGGSISTINNMWIRGRYHGTWTGWRAIPILDAGNYMNILGVRVVGPRRTGWTAATGTGTRNTFATGSVTTAQLAERVKALIDDLIAHGLIGA